VPVIAVINRKGGSGKSTVATHVAAWLAHRGEAVMLGDVDRQQSSHAWLKRRSKLDARQAPPILGWIVDKASVARPPAGTTHLVLDTPGGLTGFELARLVMWCDAILVPVCDSAFDREAAAACHAELAALPRVAGGRCRVGVIGMRIDRRTRGRATLEAWAAERGMEFVGSLRDTQRYVSAAERGLTLFDLPAAKVEDDMAEWQPVTDWLARVSSAPQAADAADAADESAATKALRRVASGADPRAHLAPAATKKPSPAGASDEHRQGDSRLSAALSLPPGDNADLSQLRLEASTRPGLWGLVRRLLGA